MATATEASQQRITAPIDESRTVILKGNLPPQARAARDEGRVSPALPIARMMLTFALSPEQQNDLSALLPAQQDSASPNYQRWLTPTDVGERFGLSRNDFDQVAHWLETHGLNVVEKPTTRMYVAFSGTAAQVEAAFHTQIHNYSLNGELAYSAVSEPVIPAALSPVIGGVHGLHNFRLRPHNVRRRSNFTSARSGNTFLSPGDFAVIYDVNPLYSANINGTGQSLAIVGQTDILQSDVDAFRTAAGLPPSSVSVVLVPGSPDPGFQYNAGDYAEAMLDLEWSGAVAKNASIIYVNSNNVFTSAIYAMNTNLAPVISMSYGACENHWASSDVNAFNTAAQLANAQGITFVAASGDSGAADCDYQATSASYGLAVDFPAASPYVTGVGGTTFNEGGNTSQYWRPATPITGDVVASALSYIPEVAWNDTALEIGLGGGIASSGGGQSMLFAKPGWQTAPGVPADSHRDVPDIAFAASADHDGYLMCAQSFCTGGTFRYTDGSLYIVGGTSVSAPAFAAVVSLLNHKTGHRQGNVNPHLYELAGSSPTIFHDITSGTNVVPCTSGSTGCGPSGQYGYSTVTGYDLVTGLGTLDVGAVANAWWSGAPTVTSTSPTGVAAGSGALTLTVNGTNFVSGVVVYWNGSERITTYVSSTQLQAAILASDVASSGSVAVTVVNPGGGMSQAAVFTISAPPRPLWITKSFAVSNVPLNGTTTLAFTISNPDPSATAHNVAFTDNLPSGLIVANPNGFAGACNGGSVTATSGSTSVSLVGGTLSPATFCTVSVNVTATTLGMKNNSVQVTADTGTGNTSGASLFVGILAPSIYQSFGNATIFLNDSTSLTFTIQNSNSSTTLTGLSFTDTLPAGLVVASSPGLSNSCGGTVTAMAGASSVSLSEGSVGANTYCTVSLNVTATSIGTKDNSVTVSSSNGGSGNTANASLTVNTPSGCRVAILGGLAIHDKTSNTSQADPVPFNPWDAVDGIANSWVTDSNGLLINSTGGSEPIPGLLIYDAGGGAGTNFCFNPGNVITIIFNGVLSNPAPGTSLSPIGNMEIFDSSGIAGLSIASAPVTAVFGANIVQTLITLTVGAKGSYGSSAFFPTDASAGGSSGSAIRIRRLFIDATTVPTATVSVAVAQSSIGAVSVVNAGTLMSQSTVATKVAGLARPVISTNFGASTIQVNSSTSLTFTLTNDSTATPLMGVTFSDYFPSGLEVAAAAGLTNSCAGSTVSAIPGSNTVSMTTGVTLAPSTSCSVTVNVTATTTGTKNNGVTVLSPTTGFGNTAMASLTVTPPGPTVTINQASSQLDPTSQGPINFTVLFSEAVTGFSNSGIAVGGTAPFGTQSVMVTGSGTTYNVAIDGMTAGGTVIPTVSAGAATSIATTAPSQASTSTDNVVTYAIKKRRGQVLSN